MTINGNERVLLEAGAQAIAAGGPAPDVSFNNMNDPFMNRDEVPTFLGQRVTELTSGILTVRQVDVNLVGRRVMGPCVYMVACQGDTPEGIVTELTDDMRLITAGPYNPGFTFDVEKATPEELQRYREFDAKRAKERAESAEEKEDINAFLERAITHAENVIGAGLSSAEDTEVARQYLLSVREPEIEHVAKFYRLLGISLKDSIAFKPIENGILQWPGQD